MPPPNTTRRASRRRWHAEEDDDAIVSSGVLSFPSWLLGRRCDAMRCDLIANSFLPLSRR
jgi:hypothetical protein